MHGELQSKKCRVERRGSRHRRQQQRRPILGNCGRHSVKEHVVDIRPSNPWMISPTTNRAADLSPRSPTASAAPPGRRPSHLEYRAMTDLSGTRSSSLVGSNDVKELKKATAVVKMIIRTNKHVFNLRPHSLTRLVQYNS